MAIAPSWSKVGIADMIIGTKSIVAAAIVAASVVAVPTVAQAGVGDLLVAPTRIVLDGRKGAEVILNNIGDEPATYRVSVEFRRMTEDWRPGRRHCAERSREERRGHDRLCAPQGDAGAA